MANYLEEALRIARDDVRIAGLWGESDEMLSKLRARAYRAWFALEMATKQSTA
jgi:hypothetical protein